MNTEFSIGHFRLQGHRVVFEYCMFRAAVEETLVNDGSKRKQGNKNVMPFGDSDHCEYN